MSGGPCVSANREPHPEVTAVIVTYNSMALIEQCIGSLLEAAKGASLEVVVVDNASSDGTVAAVRRSHPDVVIVESAENMGFARANNVGLRVARGRHVLFLNPDAFLAQGSVRALVTALEERPEVAVVGPRLENEDGTLQFSAKNFPTVANQLFEALMLHKVLLRHTRRWGGVIYDSEFYRQGGPVDWLSGAVLLVRRQAIDDVGGFDERFFLYSEEKDLQLRLAQSGWRTILVPTVAATHVHGDTYRPELFEISLRSKLAYNAKHEHGARLLAFDLALALHLAVRVGIEALSALLRRRKSPRLSGYMRGVGLVLTNRKAQGGL